MSFLELSSQNLRTEPNHSNTSAESRPLMELGYARPIYHIDTQFPIMFPFANDQAIAPTMDQLQMRTASEGYKSAHNRVALVIGESSLAASLPYISEDTIVVLDYEPRMCEYMETYVRRLRTDSSVKEWRRNMSLNAREAQSLENQVSVWHAYGFKHSLADEPAFAIARKLAAEKAIHVWNGDLRSEADLAYLARRLRALSATITLLNLTNVMQYSGAYRDINGFVDNISMLPFTSDVPIMATSAFATPLTNVGSIGPFFGIENVRMAGNTEATTFDKIRSQVTGRHFTDLDAVNSLVERIGVGSKKDWWQGRAIDSEGSAESNLLSQKIPMQWLTP